MITLWIFYTNLSSSYSNFKKIFLDIFIIFDTSGITENACFLCIVVNTRYFEHPFVIKFSGEFFDDFFKTGYFRYYRYCSIYIYHMIIIIFNIWYFCVLWFMRKSFIYNFQTDNLNPKNRWRNSFLEVISLKNRQINYGAKTIF